MDDIIKYLMCLLEFNLDNIECHECYKLHYKILTFVPPTLVIIVFIIAIIQTIFAKK